MSKDRSSEEILAKNRAKKQVQTTKKNLRKMSKSGGAHKARTARRIVKYGASGFARNIWLSIAATLVMTITLVIILTTFVASAVLSSTAQSLREKIDITIYFKPGTTQEELNDLTKIMLTDPNVNQVTTATSEKEFENFIEDNKGDEVLLKTLQDEEMKNIMIATMKSVMRIKVFNLDDTASIKNLVDTNEAIQAKIDPDPEFAPTYETNREEINTINSWAEIARRAGWILSGIFIVISFLVIFNTIRMAIFSRREEIYMMKLVGADNTFIRGPFQVEAQISGIIAGIIATTIAYIGCHNLSPYLKGYGIDISTINDIIESQKLILVYLGTILVGMSIGGFSAQLAIKKYLRQK